MDFMDCQPLTKHCFPHLNRMIYPLPVQLHLSPVAQEEHARKQASNKPEIISNIVFSTMLGIHQFKDPTQEIPFVKKLQSKTPSMWLTIYAIFILLKREIKGNFLFGLRRGTPLGQSGTVVSLTTYSGLLVKQGVGSTSKTTTKLVPNWPYCFKTTVDLLAGQPSARCGGQK